MRAPTAHRWELPAGDDDVTERPHDAMIVHDPADALDPLGDAEQTEKGARTAPRSARPPVVAALHLRPRRDHGPAAVLGDAAGLDDWEPIWHAARRHPARSTSRGCSTWCGHLGSRSMQLRPFPWQPKTEQPVARRATTSASRRGSSRSGCAAPAATCSGRSPSSTTRTPTRSAPTRPASSTQSAPAAAGRRARQGRTRAQPAVPARYLLACTDGHPDEFPYDLWVHRGQACPKAEFPA